MDMRKGAFSRLGLIGISYEGIPMLINCTRDKGGITKGTGVCEIGRFACNLICRSLGSTSSFERVYRVRPITGLPIALNGSLPILPTVRA